ncbi:MAG: DUF2336 domain-containing protein [Alphaproteobacteria bacterium]
MTVQKAPTELDLEEIAALARGRNAVDRAALIEALNDGVGARIAAASERERLLFDGILDQLLASIEHDVRARLAERLAARPDAPRPLIALLANQDIDIARPVLLHSRALQDDDLVEIVRHRTLEHQLAVAARDSLSEEVSEELVGTGQTRVITTLLRNHGARIREATLAYLAEQAERVDAFREPLVHRHDLPPHVAKRLYRLVAGALRDELSARFDIDVTIFDAVIEQVIQAATAALAASRRHPTMAQALADELAQTERFDARLMVDALKRGEVALFEAMLIQQSGLRPGDVRWVVYDTDGEPLAVLCRAIGVTPACFSDVFELTRRSSRRSRAVADEMHERALALFQRLDKEAAAALMRAWRREPRSLRERFGIDEREKAAVA